MLYCMLHKPTRAPLNYKRSIYLFCHCFLVQQLIYQQNKRFAFLITFWLSTKPQAWRRPQVFLCRLKHDLTWTRSFPFYMEKLSINFAGNIFDIGLLPWLPQYWCSAMCCLACFHCQLHALAVWNTAISYVKSFSATWFLSNAVWSNCNSYGCCKWIFVLGIIAVGNWCKLGCRRIPD